MLVPENSEPPEDVMRTMRSKYSYLFAALLTAASVAGCVSTGREGGFVALFDGASLKGWTLVGKTGEGYGVRDGILYCARHGGGNLLTEREYDDFILRLEFKLEAGGNNGIGIRAPLAQDVSSSGMEIQVLDDTAPAYAGLRAAQYCGSIYDVVPARRGALRKVGEWNEEEITCRGRHVRVKLNGQEIVDANLNDITDPKILAKHPGLLRRRGRVGFLGHDDYVQFRNIRIRELPRFPRNNVAPEGFAGLFDGVSLAGWKGLVADPPKRARMSAVERATAQERADRLMRENWRVENGTLVYRGKAFDNLCTIREYANFELQLDWKISENGDSGIYLRGSPQVQIWDPSSSQSNPRHEGSGGLYNNQKNPSGPSKRADRYRGEWNHFDILMTGDKVSVSLNDESVVHEVTLENYWERDRPIYASGAIELQAHTSPVSFRNIYIRELPPN